MTASLVAAPPATIGEQMYALIAELYPICRSITGDGVRETLHRVQREIPLTLHEVPTGTRVFDWTVPQEWNIRDAYVKNSRGVRIIDFRRSNLHVLNYSTAVHRQLTLAELKPHLFTLPEHPDWVPYRTSYYNEAWGFCLTHNQLAALEDGDYEACIDSTLADGHLTYGEWLVAGESTDEVLISCHSCHPSLANDNLSGVALAVALAQHVAAETRHLSYRFLFIPGTIGSITWLAHNEDVVPRIRAGLVLSCVGDAGPPTYKRSRRGDTLLDRAVIHVLEHSGAEHEVLDFTPYGYDERQYCSPGFNLPVGCFMRTPHGRFPEYHTSADDLEFVTPESLADSYAKCLEVIDILEHDARYRNVSPKCEPQLGTRGLYPATGEGALPGFELALLWVLNLSDGDHGLLDIAERAGMRFGVIRRAAEVLAAHELLRRLDPAT
jgi:aminopeptidase-like protein